jgi:hypothetical protein
METPPLLPDAGEMLRLLRWFDRWGLCGEIRFYEVIDSGGGSFGM